MIYRILAESVLVLHLGFVLFAVLGGLLVLRWRWAVWLHLPAVAWAVLVMANGWICPLTPLENYFRLMAGQAGYSGGFIEQYLISVLYPAGITRGIQVALGLGVLILNLEVYRRVFRRVRRSASGLEPTAQHPYPSGSRARWSR